VPGRPTDDGTCVVLRAANDYSWDQDLCTQAHAMICEGRNINTFIICEGSNINTFIICEGNNINTFIICESRNINTFIICEGSNINISLLRGHYDTWS
jgi:hypothetical protein